MSQNAEILAEGSYLYFKGENNFSQENFKLVQLHETEALHIYAEVLSRLETGEFLKVLVRYEMNASFLPTQVRIEKSIGNKYASELFKVDYATQLLSYQFQNSQGIQDFTKPFNTKHYLASPAFATSAVFTLTKRFDATGRTPITLISSNNDWKYEAPPTEKLVYAEYESREMDDFILNNQHLTASHLKLFDSDSSASVKEPPVELFISKHYAIPYQLLHGDLKIAIKNLKKNK
jgi:hypothetical protein